MQDSVSWGKGPKTFGLEADKNKNVANTRRTHHSFHNTEDVSV